MKNLEPMRTRDIAGKQEHSWPCRLRAGLKFGGRLLAAGSLFWLACLPAVAAPGDEVPSSASPGSLEELPDLFGPLRRHEPDAAPRQRWVRFAAGLRNLASLEGVHFDKESRQMIFFGPRSEEPGPLSMDDLIVALRARFFSLDEVGMTIDPAPDNKRGEDQIVRYFGGTEGTLLGWMMFECDRLMKCLSLGKDNLTGESLRSETPDFFTMPELVLHLGEEEKGPLWSRFWIVRERPGFPENDSRGKAVLEVSEDGQTVVFAQWALSVLTEEMHNPGTGKDFVAAKDRENPAAKRFADFLSVKYRDIAVEFPAFERLWEMAKMVSVADWIYESNLPIDHELLYLRLYEWPTPTTTKAIEAEAQKSDSRGTSIAKVFGGVGLGGTTFFAQDTGAAREGGATVRTHLHELRRGNPVQAEVGGKTMQFVPAPDPSVPAFAFSETMGPKSRPAFLLGESRTGSGSMPGTLRPAPASDQVGIRVGNRQIPAFKDQEIGAECFNLPVLRVVWPAGSETICRFTIDGRQVEMPVPRSASLTSPLRDIRIEFKNEPDFDVARGEGYLPSQTEGVLGYYPKSNRVILSDGTSYRFDGAGVIQEVEMPGRPKIEFAHEGYRDSAMVSVRSEGRDPNLMPRPPPSASAESTGVLTSRQRSPAPLVQSESTGVSTPRDPAWWEKSNPPWGDRFATLHHNYHLAFASPEPIPPPAPKTGFVAPPGGEGASGVSSADPKLRPRPPPIGILESSGRVDPRDPVSQTGQNALDFSLLSDFGVRVREEPSPQFSHLSAYEGRAVAILPAPAP